MSKSPGATLERLIKEGRNPDEAASAVLLSVLGEQTLAELSDTEKNWLYGLVQREARHIDGRLANRRMKRVLGKKGMSLGTAHFEEATRKLQQTVYRTAEGERVLWDDLTPADVEKKIALLRKQFGALAEHITILEAARDLMKERGVSRLGDIPDWPELVRKMTEGGAA